MPLVLTYHTRLKNVNDIIKKHLVFLYAKEQVDNIFAPPPSASFRAGFSLRKHLVRPSGCNKIRCQICLNVNNAGVNVALMLTI